MIRTSLAGRTVAAVLLCAGLFVSWSARAQEPSASALAVARELVEIRGGANMFDVVVAGVVEQGRGLFLQTNPGLAKDLDEVAKKLRTEFSPRRAEVVTEMSRIYAQRFSEQEMKDAIAFYKTALGKKILTEEPVIIDQSFTRLQQWAAKLSDEVVTKYRAEMKKRGHDL